MGTGRAVVCVLSAMIGAGFASGREVMAFFSRYGGVSWGLCALFGAEMGFLCWLVIRDEKEWGGKWLLSLLYLFTAASMTAAAGDLWALTTPFHGARTVGAGVTLALCCMTRKKPLGALNALGRMLIMLMMIMIILCFTVPGETGESDATDDGSLSAVFGMLGYGGMNAALCSHIMREAVRGEVDTRKKRRIAAVIGCFAFLILALENGALIRHPELKYAALPTVMLLRAYGKFGYGLSALLLYMAVITTLISSISGFDQTLPDNQCTKAGIPLVIFAVSLIGFSGIVERFYPLMGWLNLLPLIIKKRARFGRA